MPRQVLAKFLKILSKRDKSKSFTRIISQAVIRGKNAELLCVELTAAVKKGNRVLGITMERIESKTEDSILLNASPLCLHKS